VTGLEAALGHQFADPLLLERALIHRSFQAEHPESDDNERMEFLGDAVLGVAVASYLYQRHPGMSEGQMAKVRAVVVSRDELAEVARSLDLGQYLVLGRGEESTGGRDKASILANAVEAVIAAVYLDAGFDVACRFVVGLWETRIQARTERPGGADYKTRLQEMLATAGLRPDYRVEAFGPEHAKRFIARLIVDGEVRGEGSGASKREAEQDAARAAIEAERPQLPPITPLDHRSV
jgi:ribonuclease III